MTAPVLNARPATGAVTRSSLAPFRAKSRRSPDRRDRRYQRSGRANLQAPAVVGARKRFDDAGAALRAAVAEKPGLLAIAVHATPSEGISFCRPATFPGLRQLQELGLELVVPEGGTTDINEDFSNFFFDSVSLELANKYPADLILLDADTPPEEMASVPTWAALPAVQANQIAAFRRLGSWTPTSSTPARPRRSPPPSAPPTPTSSDGGPHDRHPARPLLPYR
jgi:hypothetical protein